MPTIKLSQRNAPTLSYLHVPTSNYPGVQSDSQNAANACHGDHKLVLMRAFADDLINIQSTTLDA
jgi:hypothetical protein